METSEKIKVLEVNVDDNFTGGVYSLVKNVIQHKPENISIDIGAIEKFESQANIDELNRLGTQVYWIGSDGNKLQKQKEVARNLTKLIEEQHYDYVHVHADVANKLLVSGRAAYRTGIPKVILHSHAAGVDGEHRALKKLFHYVSRRKLKDSADLFATCSDAASEWMFPNVPKDQITEVHNGIDTEKFRYDPETRAKVRTELGLKDEILLGHVGRFAYQKNHRFLILLMQVLKQRGISAKLLLIGEGPMEAEIRNQAEKAEVTDNVIFYGTASNVNELMQAMDIFVLPSHFEGLPIVGVEAQSAGLPCIFSDQISRETALCSAVSFLGIKEKDADKWADTAVEYAHYERKNGADTVRSRGFDISDTVKQFIELYTDGGRI